MSDKIKEATEKVTEATKNGGNKVKKFVEDHKTLFIAVGCGVGGYLIGKYAPAAISSLMGGATEVAEAAVETIV